MITAFVLIEAEPTRIAPLAESLAEIDGVYEVYSVAGDVDIVAVVRVRTNDELAERADRIVHVQGGRIVEPAMVAA